MSFPLSSDTVRLNRRDWLTAVTAAAWAGTNLPAATGQGVTGSAVTTKTDSPARIAITLDLEMSRNFPVWENTHWDYEKGNLDAATKDWAVEAARRVKARGARIHFFVVGRVFEQEDIRWLKSLNEDGHRIGNHTYDHVNLLAKKPSEIQFRFQRAPWLIEGRSVPEVLRENIRLTEVALKQRLQIDSCGFRTPGGFSSGLKERPDVQALLKEAGFPWISSLYPSHRVTAPETRPDEAVLQSIVEAQSSAQPFVYPNGLIEIPMSPISDIGAFRTGRWKLEWFLAAIERSVRHCIEHGLVFDFLGHPSCLCVTDPRHRTIDLLCDLVESAGNRAALVTLDQIAAQVV